MGYPSFSEFRFVNLPVFIDIVLRIPASRTGSAHTGIPPVDASYRNGISSGFSRMRSIIEA
jgi:hypothetical protein